MEDYIIKVHVTLNENSSEIFYQRLLKNIDDCFKIFKIKLAERHDVLKHSRFEVAWIDDDGDKIIILDEDDFSIFLEMKRTTVQYSTVQYSTVLVQVDFNSTEKPTHKDVPILPTDFVGSNLSTVPDSAVVDLGKKIDRRSIFRMEPTSVNKMIEISGQLMTVKQALEHLIQTIRDPTSGPDQPSKILQILKSNPPLMAAFIKQAPLMRRSAGGNNPKQPGQLPQMMGQQPQHNQEQGKIPPNLMQITQASMFGQPGTHAAEISEKSEDCAIDEKEINRNSIVSSKEEQALENEEIHSRFSSTSSKEPQTLTKRASDKELVKIPVDPNTWPKLFTVSPFVNESIEQSTVTKIPTNVWHEKQTDRSSAIVPNTLMLEKQSDSSSNDVEVLRNLSLDASKKQHTAEVEGVVKIPVLSKCTFSVDDSSSDEKEIDTVEDPRPRKSDCEDSSSDDEKADVSTESDYSSSFEVLQCDSSSSTN